MQVGPRPLSPSGGRGVLAPSSPRDLSTTYPVFSSGDNLSDSGYDKSQS